MAAARNIALLFWKTQREESQEIAENHAKLARRRLYRYLRPRSLVSSVFLLLLTRQLFQCGPSLRRLWSKNRSQSFWEETCQGWSGEILRFCFGKHRGKKAKKSRKITQSLPGDDSTDTSAPEVLCHLYFYCC